MVDQGALARIEEHRLTTGQPEENQRLGPTRRVITSLTVFHLKGFKSRPATKVFKGLQQLL
jgi:hypothetical protein